MRTNEIKKVKGCTMPGGVYSLYYPIAAQHITKTCISTGLGELELGSRKQHVEADSWAKGVGTGKSVSQSNLFLPKMILRQNVS